MDANDSGTRSPSRHRRRMPAAAVAGVIFGMYALVPAGSALGASSSSSPLDPRSLPFAQRPAAATPSLTAEVEPNGAVKLGWHHTPPNATGFDVARSTGGGTPVALTSRPVFGHSFIDRSVSPGTAYTYTVTVGAVSGAKLPAAAQPQLAAPQGVGHATVGDTVGTTTVTTAPQLDPAAAPPGDVTPSDIAGGAPSWPAVLGDAATQAPATAPAVRSGPFPLLDPACQLSGTLSSDTTLAPTAQCPNVEITAAPVVAGVAPHTVTPFTVPAGTTLTLNPGSSGLTVYVDPGVVIDVIGTLISNGTGTAPVTVTSAFALPGSGALPAPGDWPGIVFAPDASQTASTLDDTNISYHTMVLSIPGGSSPSALPPVISGGSMTHMVGESDLLSPGLLYLQPGAPVSISGLNYSAPPNALLNGILVADVGNGLTLQVTNSTVTAGVPFVAVELSSGEASLLATPTRPFGATLPAVTPPGTGNDAHIAATITGNNFTQYSLWPELGLIALQSGDSGTPGTATLTGTVANNTLNGASTLVPFLRSWGALFVAAASSTQAPTGTAPATPTCASGFYAVCDDIAMTNDTVSAQGPTVLEWSDNNSGAGNVLNANAFSGGSYSSQNGSAIVSLADNQGLGSAGNVSSYSNDPLTGHRAGLISRARTAAGDATSSPAVSGTSITAGAGNDGGSYLEAVNNAAQAGGTIDNCPDVPGPGAATADPTVTGGTLQTNGNVITNWAWSCGGAATANPAVTDGSLSSTHNDGVDNAAYASEWSGNAPATADPTVTGSQIASEYQGLRNYAEGEGAATANPVVRSDTARSILTNRSGDGIENGAESLTSYYCDLSGATPALAPTTVPFPAIANPQILSSDVTSGSDSLDNWAAAGSGDNPADASFTLTDATLTSSSDDAVDASSYGSGAGTSTTTPTVDKTTATANDDGFDLWAGTEENDSAGAATIAGSIADTTIATATDDPVEAADGAGSGGAATVTTQMSNLTLSGTGDDGIEMSADGYGAGAQVTPSLAGSTINLGAAHGYALDMWSWGFGGAGVTTAPVIDNTPSTSSDGVDLWAADWDTPTWPGAVHVGGHLAASPVAALNGDGVDAWADCENCGAVPTSFAQGHVSYTNPGALEDLAVTGTTVSSYDAAGWFSAYSEPNGVPAVVATAVDPGQLGAWQSYDSTAIFSSAYSDGTGPAESDLSVKDVHASGYGSIGDVWNGASDIENYVYSDSGAALNASTVASDVLDNKWSSRGYPALSEETHGDTTSTSSSQVTGNQVSDVLGTSAGDELCDVGYCGARAGGTGIYEYVGASGGGNEHPNMTIADNVVTNVGAKGIWVDTQGNSPPGQSLTGPDADVVHVLGNQVGNTGEEGIRLDGVLADVQHNTQTRAGLAGTSAPDGILVDNAASTGQLICNAFSGNAQGVQYGGNSSDPVTNDNAFTGADGTGNGPLNLTTDNTSGTPTDAQDNWWGTTDPTAIAATTNGNVDSSNPLAASPLGSPPCMPPPPPPPPNGGGFVPTGGTGGGSGVGLTSRIGGPDRIGTAIAISQQSFGAGGAGAVVLARSTDFPDALAGSPLAVANNAPLLLTPSANLDPAVASEIQRVLPPGGTVYLLGGTGALSSAVAGQVAALGYTPVRLAGADRYATAVAIASTLPTVSRILVANGANFPDAVSASAATGTPGTVIVLTNGTLMPAETAAFLAAHSVPTWAIGGPAAAADPAATAVDGTDRYATAVDVAHTFFTAPTGAGIATGLAFPDALAAGPRLARLGDPLLLTDPTTLPSTVAGYLTANKATITHVEIYGGTAAITSAIDSAVTAALS